MKSIDDRVKRVEINRRTADWYAVITLCEDLAGQTIFSAKGSTAEEAFEAALSAWQTTLKGIEELKSEKTTAGLKLRLIDGITEPKRFGGVDYGAPGRVLLRTKTHKLIRRGGRHYWSSSFEPQKYAPACLEWQKRGGGFSLSEAILEGGQLTLGRLMAASDVFVAVTGLPEELIPEVMAAYREKLTVEVIDDD